MTMLRTTIPLFAAVVISALAACMPSAKVATTKLGDYRGDPKRLFVIEAMGGELGRYTTSFQNSLQKTLAACGLTAAFLIRPLDTFSLELDESKQRAAQAAEQQAMRSFAPDAILVISQTSHRTELPTRYVREISYALELVDAASNKPIWRGQVALNTAFDMVDFGDAGATLARSITDRMRLDGVLHSCPSDPAS